MQGGDVEDEVTRLQQLIFRSQGVDGAFGITCLGQVHESFKRDQELLQAFVEFVNRCDLCVVCCADRLACSVTELACIHTQGRGSSGGSRDAA